MNVKRKTPVVNLRQRKLASGRVQLFLDVTIDGHRNRESLNMFLEEGRDRLTREKNKETLAIATEIADRRQKQERDIANGIDRITDGLNVRFMNYFQQCADSRDDSTKKTWETVLFHIKRYEKNENISILRINKDWLEGFKQFMLSSEKYSFARYTGKRVARKGTKISESTVALAMSKISSCLNSAVKEGILPHNPATMISKVKSNNEREREFLTKDEVNKLLNTDIPQTSIGGNDYSKISRRAIIFSIMTGLRMSDVLQLTWNMISIDNDGRYRVTFQQVKTKRNMYLDINARASEQLGTRGAPTDKIFAITPSSINYHLKQWIDAAGIKKHITFHCCRHTFATLALQAGADLYTTSKLLGHSDVRTTQIYAKIVDKQKQKAVDLLQNFL